MKPTRDFDKPSKHLDVSVHRSIARTICLFVLMSLLSCARSETPDRATDPSQALAREASEAKLTQPSAPETTAPPKASELKWTSLFDSKSLEGWEITKFGGEGEVEVKDGQLILGVGSDMTGVHTNRPLPKIDYEVTLEAMRVDGSDFFCGLTFPVQKQPCSLILGGWGGGVCGLSSIDGMDASENETTTFESFENGRWYRIRLRVTRKKIQAWIDNKQIVDQDITGRRLSVRIEIEQSKPFGFATWQTTGALRDIRIRRLTAAEIGSGSTTAE